MRTQQYETLVLISGGRATLDHLVQAFDIHAPDACALVDELAAEGLIKQQSRWYTGCLRYETTASGAAALAHQRPDQARGAESLCADEAAILDAIASTGTPPDSADLRWNPSSTVQYLWETGAIAMSGMVRPRLALEQRS